METYQTLEGELADEKLGRLLVATNLTESDGTGLVAVRLLDATGRGGRLARSLGGELLTRGLATSGFTCDGMLVDVLWCCATMMLRQGARSGTQPGQATTASSSESLKRQR